MISKRMVQDKIEEFEKRGLIGRNPKIKTLKKNFMEKARHNLETAQMLNTVSSDSKAKTALNVSTQYEGYDWVIVAAYYAMYHAAMAALAAIGVKSDDHEATKFGLLYYYVLEGALEKRYVESLEKARKLEEEYVQQLHRAKRTRQIAQYSVEGEFSKAEAESLIEDAAKFVNRLNETVLDS